MKDRTLTPERIVLVRQTFEALAPISSLAAALFYERMFELYPGLRSMFHGDADAQQRMFMQAMGAAVRGLSDLPALRVKLEDLGRRHERYGVCDAHYETMLEALLWTLQQTLGEEFFDAEASLAWTIAFRQVADIMKAAAREERLALTVR
jgi:nitric oxide dioxygenase